MKKTMLILCAVALVLILLTVGLLAGLFSALGGGKGSASAPSLEAYLAESWPLFSLRRWDPEQGQLELDYPLRFTYKQMKKYGAVLEELRELPAGNLETAAVLKAAALEAADTTIREVTVYGLTSDGEVAYTVYPDGTLRACWDADTP